MAHYGPAWGLPPPPGWLPPPVPYGARPESWDDNNVPQDGWAAAPNGHPAPYAPSGPPGAAPGYAPPPPGVHHPPYYQAPPPPMPMAMGTPPPAGWPGPPRAANGMTEAMVQAEIHRKETEIQRLRQQLADLDHGATAPPPAGHYQNGAPPDPRNGFGLRAAAPPFGASHLSPTASYPPAPGPGEYNHVNGGGAVGVGPPLVMEDAEDEVVQQCLRTFDEEVRKKIDAEIEEGVGSGALPEGAEPFPEDCLPGEEEEEDEEDLDGLPGDEEYWDFIRADQEAEARKLAEAADKAKAGTEATPGACPPAAPAPGP